MQRRDVQALLAIDPATLENGKECGLRSIIFLLGALETTSIEPNILSYEGPFGVGYLVATFRPRPKTETVQITKLARDAITHYLETGQILPTPSTAPAVLSSPAGIFVSLHQPNGQLRGCIGTITSSKPSAAAELISSAIAAATQDPRFPPVTIQELPQLIISVDILSPPSTAINLNQLDPQIDGLIVSTIDGRQGLLLPALPDITTVQEQISICRHKANIGTSEPITILSFHSQRYQE